MRIVRFVSSVPLSSIIAENPAIIAGKDSPKWGELSLRASKPKAEAELDWLAISGKWSFILKSVPTRARKSYSVSKTVK